MSKRWLVADDISEEVKKQFPDIHPVVLQLLSNRGLHTQEEFDVYLNPDWDKHTYGPELFREMPVAVARVFDVLAEGGVVTVHGDYDADGVCGATVLVATLKDLCRAFGYDESLVTYYIPHREKEGYGMSVATIERLHAEEKTKLVVTVDCGISNKEAVDRGKELGIDTIVCDHHTMPEELPDAILIHPLVPGETFPNKHLCGTAVAFKFASGLIHEAQKRGSKFPEGYEKWLLDLVAIATVTDVMPLSGENRVLETYGLKVLNKTKRVGLQKLIDISGGKMGALDTFSIGFQIGPRINAAGRMEHAHRALELLIEEDELRATELAMRLDSINIERRKASEVMYLEAKKMVGELGDRKLIVVSSEGWPAGLVGLVAGKLVNDYNVPAYVVGKDGDHYVGSGRSIDGYDVTATMRAAGEHLDKLGGHPQACGFSTNGDERFLKAKEVMEAYAKEHLDEDSMVATLNVDAQVELEAIDWDFYDLLEKFRPFGNENPKPVFSSVGLTLVSFSTVGKEGAHLKLRLQSKGGKIFNAIAFRFGHMTSELKLGGAVDVVHEVDVNEWNGSRSLQLRVIDIKNTSV